MVKVEKVKGVIRVQIYKNKVQRRHMFTNFNTVNHNKNLLLFNRLKTYLKREEKLFK